MSIVAGMPEHEYHARSELSSTGARLLLDSPARFKYRMSHPFHSDAFDLGTAVHSKVLGVGTRAVAYPAEHLTPAGNISTKAATVAWVAEQRAAGQVLVSPNDMAAVNAMAEAVLAHPTARKILEVDGIPEASVFARDIVTNVSVRARFDFLPTEGEMNVAVDLKTTAGKASSAAFAKDAAKYAYHIQEAHYLDTLAFARGHRNAEMVFLVVEKDPPHLVAVHQLDEQFAQIGQDQARQAREIFGLCLATDDWPGYPTDIIQTPPPAWLVYQHQDQYDQEIEVA